MVVPAPDRLLPPEEPRDREADEQGDAAPDGTAEGSGLQRGPQRGLLRPGQSRPQQSHPPEHRKATVRLLLSPFFSSLHTIGGITII